MKTKRISIFALIALSACLVIATIKAYSYNQEYLGFVEVCNNGIAYVPRGTKFVKCHGIVKKIVIFESGATVDEDCACLNQKCCDGLCYVFIETDPETIDVNYVTDSNSVYYRLSDINNILAKIWISC
jgi:hypothetical protein